MRWVIRVVLATLVLAGLIGAYVFYPYWTLSRIDAAARNGDMATLEMLIDWDRVRAGVRADMNAMVMRKAAAEAGDKAFAALGTAIGGAIVERMVDGTVTPSGLIEARKTNATADMRNIVSRVWFASPTIFVVTLRKEDEVEGGEVPVQLMMELSGLTWRITRALIDVPRLDALVKAAEGTATPAKSKPKKKQ